MIYNFPTLQQGMANTAFDIARPGLERRIANHELLAKEAILQRSLLAGNPGPMPQPPQQPQQPQRPQNFGGFRAMGGPVVPGRSYVVGERKAPRKALNMDPMTGEVYQDTERRAGDTGPALGGVTFFDVANFGSYNGHGTSQGGIGRGSSISTAHTGLSNFYGNNLNMKPMEAGFTPSVAQNPAGMRMPKDLQQRFDEAGRQFADPMFMARRALGTPGPAPEVPGRPLVVGDAMDPETAAMMDAYTRDSYSTGNGPLPEIMVSPSGAQVVGQNGPEVIVPKEPSYIIPNPANIAAARSMGVPSTIQMGQIAQAPAAPAPLQLAAMPPVAQMPAPAAPAPAPAPTGYQPIGSNYQPAQPGLQWTGSGFAHAPGGVRKTDIRRFMRSPQGVGMVMSLAAGAIREKRMDQRWQDREKQQFNTQMALKKSEDDMADIISKEKINALSGTSSILTPGDAETLSKINAPKAREAALETIVRLRIDERERKARDAERAKELESSRRFTDVPGTDYIMNERGQTLPKARPEKPAMEPPEGFEITGYSVNGTPMLRKVKTEPAMRTVLDAMGDLKEFPAGKKLPPGWKELEDETPADSASVPAPARAKIKSITPVP